MKFLSNLRLYLASAMRLHGSALLSFLGATLAVASLIASNLTEEPASTQWNVLEGIGVFIAAIGALISSVQQSRGAEEIQEKNVEIVRLQRQTSDTITGGKEYCYLQIMPDRNDEQSIYVMPPRQYALHDVRIHYGDTSTALAHGQQVAESLFRLVKEGAAFNAMGLASYEEVRHLGLVPPYGFFKLRPININCLPFAINVRFYARNGQWHQSIILVRGNDGRAASVDFVVRIVPLPFEILRRYVSSNFPNPDRIFVRTRNGAEEASDIPFICIPDGG